MWRFRNEKSRRSGELGLLRERPYVEVSLAPSGLAIPHPLPSSYPLPSFVGLRVALVHMIGFEDMAQVHMAPVHSVRVALTHRPQLYV